MLLPQPQEGFEPECVTLRHCCSAGSGAGGSCQAAGRAEWRGVFHNRRKDGSFYWESASISPVKGRDGAITHSVVMRSKSGTVRYVEAHHNFAMKTWVQS